MAVDTTSIPRPLDETEPSIRGLVILGKPGIPFMPIAITSGLLDITVPVLGLVFALGSVPLSIGVEFIDLDPEPDAREVLEEELFFEGTGRMVLGD